MTKKKKPELLSCGHTTDQEQYCLRDGCTSDIEREAKEKEVE